MNSDLRAKVEKLLPKPTRYFGHSTQSPMYNREEMLEFAQLIYKSIISDIRQEDAARISAMMSILERASESLGAFCGDEGWGQTDMDNMDAVDGCIAANANLFFVDSYRESERKRIRNEVLEEAADELEKTCAGERWAIFELRAMREE
jgi:hypothetical protein